MLLNTLDLLFCFSSTLVLITGKLHASKHHVIVIAFSIFNFLYCVLLESTAFVTCTLAITRTICVWFPFYRVQRRTICGMVTGYFLYLLAKGVLYLYVHHSHHPAEALIGQTYDGLAVVAVSCMVFLVTAAAIASIVRLSKTNNQDLGWHRITETNRDATTTVLILSGLFLVFNLGFLVMLSLQVAGCDATNGCLSRVVYELGMLGIPLNSAINPIVYFFRNRHMFQYMRDTARKFYCSRKCCFVFVYKVNRNETHT